MRSPPCSQPTGRWLALVLLSLGAQVAIAASATHRLARCSWDHPGHDPFMGNVVAAVDRYTDIPREVRERLQQRMAQRRYDDLVSIRRDSIEGLHRYDSAIRDMHFGAGTVCNETTRMRWTAQMHERGLVYCDGGHCILVPTVCRNVSRIARRPAPQAEPPLLFDPPAAGPLPPPLEGDTFMDIATPPAPPPLVAPDAAPTRLALGGAPAPLFGGPGVAPPRVPPFASPPVSDVPSWEEALPVRRVPYDGMPTHIAAVPEASTSALLLAGLGWLALRQRARSGARWRPV
jgi:hypothetical protein